MPHYISLRGDVTADKISRMLERVATKFEWQYGIFIAEDKSYHISIYTGKNLGTHFPEGIEITLSPRKKYSEIYCTGSLGGENLKRLRKELNAIKLL
jgi:hypothetical protein